MQLEHDGLHKIKAKFNVKVELRVWLGTKGESECDKVFWCKNWWDQVVSQLHSQWHHQDLINDDSIYSIAKNFLSTSFRFHCESLSNDGLGHFVTWFILGISRQIVLIDHREFVTSIPIQCWSLAKKVHESFQKRRSWPIPQACQHHQAALDRVRNSVRGLWRLLHWWES